MMLKIMNKKYIKLPIIILLVLISIYLTVFGYLYKSAPERAKGLVARELAYDLTYRNTVRAEVHRMFLSFDETYYVVENHYYYVKVKLSGSINARDPNNLRDTIKLPFRAIVEINPFDDEVTTLVVDEIW